MKMNRKDIIMKNRARKSAVKIMMVIFLSAMASGLIQEFNSVEKTCGYMVEAKTKKKAVMSKKQAAKNLKKIGRASCRERV